MKQMEAGPVLITKEGKKIDLSDFMLDNDKANKMADELAIHRQLQLLIYTNVSRTWSPLSNQSLFPWKEKRKGQQGG